MTKYGKDGLMISEPACEMVDSHKEHKQAEDQFYDAMFEGDEERMLAANNAVGYYESMGGIACPEYPGF